MKKYISRLKGISRGAIIILNIILPVFIAELFWFAAEFISAAPKDPVGACDRFAQILPYVMINLPIAFGGALLFDLSEKERRGE